MIVKIQKNSDLKKVNQSLQKIYIQRPITFKFLKKIIFKLSDLKEIYLSKSTFSRMGKKSLLFIKMKKIKTILANFKGKPLNSLVEKLTEINDFKRDALSIRKISEKTKLPKSTIHYLFKYAKKNKIKKEDLVIILSKPGGIKQ